MNRYQRLIEHIFFKHYTEGNTEVLFDRPDIVKAAEEIGVELTKNLGDVVCSFRYRTSLPERILSEAPPGKEWVIKPAGRARYRFALFAFEQSSEGIGITLEKHYVLVSPDQLTDEELRQYGRASKMP